MDMDREEQGVERRTPYDCAGCDGFPTAGNDPCEVCGASSSHATPDAVNADKAVAPITADELGEIMQEEWGEICEDAQAHPEDISRMGRKLFYNPRHWTAAIARRLSERTPTPDKALMPEAAVGEPVAWVYRGGLRDIVCLDRLPEAYRSVYDSETPLYTTPTPVEEPACSDCQPHDDPGENTRCSDCPHLFAEEQAKGATKPGDLLNACIAEIGDGPFVASIDADGCWGVRLAAEPEKGATGELVEIVSKAIYDATHAGLSNCYDWNDLWEDHQEAGRDRYYKEARAAIAALAATNAGQVEGKLGYDDAWAAYEPAAGKEVIEKMSWPQVCAVRHAFIAGFSAALKANGDAS